MPSGSKSWAPRAAALLSLFVFLWAAPAQAILIDSFNDGTLTINTPGFDTVDGAGIVGGERDMVGSFWNGTMSSNAGGSGLLQISASSPDINVPPLYDIRYDGDDNTTANDFTGLGGVDLTDAGASNAVRIRLLRSTTTLNLDLELSEQKTAGENTFASIGITLPAVSTATDFFLPFAAFTNPGCNFCTDTSPVDFTNVDWMEFSLNPPTSTGFALAADFIDTILAPTTVPEPAAAALFAAGLAGLGFARRRKTHSSRRR